MFGRNPLLPLVCLLTPLLTVTACSTQSNTPKKTNCKQLHERNRKCVDALVKALHSRMDKSVPADIKAKLAKHLALEITKASFVGKCRELSTGKDDRSQTIGRALVKCRAEADCAAYASCFLRVMDRARKSPKATSPPAPRR